MKKPRPLVVPEARSCDLHDGVHGERVSPEGVVGQLEQSGANATDCQNDGGASQHRISNPHSWGAVRCRSCRLVALADWPSDRPLASCSTSSCPYSRYRNTSAC